MTHFPGVSRWLDRCSAWAAASVAVLALCPALVRADVSPQDVDSAVDKGVKNLLNTQKPDGSWETAAKPKGPFDGGYSEDAKWGGETAICTYALLSAGVKPDEPKLKKAIEWLEANELHGTYAVGLRSQIYHLILPQITDPGRIKAILAARDRDKDFVLASRIQHGKAAGFYGYAYGTETAGKSPGAAPMKGLDPKGPKEGSWYDRSNSQYGVLGAWALEQAGAEIPNEYWAMEDKAWSASQLGTGGWNYQSDGDNSQATYTMTAAGIATLFITQDYMLRADPTAFASCHGGMSNKYIEKGLAWMDKNIQKAFSAGEWHYYGLYGIERIGVASGRKYFGTVDWYKNGADTIVHGQGGDGSWGAPHDTCFSILFLVRGRAPVIMNKLIYDTATKKQADPWNERPRDLANLAKWMGGKSLDNTFLNWQVVNLKVEADELHDAPILYITGSEDLTLSNQEIDKLRQFVEQGGMILGNADCASHNFTTSFEKLGNKIFPKYEFRKLPPNHIIFTGQMFQSSKWRSKPAVEGMSNGVREIMMVIPDADPSRAWQTDATKTREEAFQLAGNIFLYATGREHIFTKGNTYIVHAQGEAGKEVKVARLEIGDNSDPEPGAWRRISAILHNTKHIDVKAIPVKLGSSTLATYKIASLTGTTKFFLNADQRAELKDFVDKGGTLIVDAAGGSSEFATSAESELSQIFGAAAAKALANPLPADSIIYTDPTNKIDTIAYRIYARRAITGSMRQGRVHGIEVAGGRIGVFYSREDITAGCVGENVDGIVGYDPGTATQLMSNMVMYAVSPPAPKLATTAPSPATQTATPAPAGTAPSATAK